MKTNVIVSSLFLATALTACGEEEPAVTYWQNVAPIYTDKCIRCHQEGGIGPFRLDTYASAKDHAALANARVAEGTMPPYFMVHDGSCQSFHDETTLTDAQKKTIADWVAGGAAEGNPGTITLPAKPVLEGAVDMATPSFSPVPAGGALAEFDEYRCFLMDAPVTSDQFITGYDVSPGDATIVHHVIGFVVDPQAIAGGGRTNSQMMQILDDESPDRLGWPCFGGAGDGVNPNSLPVTWAPGQGIVSYPAGMGVPVRATDKIVVQVHYNLADLGSAGRTDSTKIHLRFAPSVNRELAFLLDDPFLGSLEKATPDMLPPGKTETSYTWMLSGEQMGIGGPISSVDLVAVMPHMHGRGVRQVMRLGPAGNMACASRLEKWNFHWQEFYFYETPLTITPTTQVEVKCDYDTSRDSAPVYPGWGTRNEMCLNVMMVALPAR